jgi:hypothetical protein
MSMSRGPGSVAELRVPVSATSLSTPSGLVAPAPSYYARQKALAHTNCAHCQNQAWFYRTLRFIGRLLLILAIVVVFLATAGLVWFLIASRKSGKGALGTPGPYVPPTYMAQR